MRKGVFKIIQESRSIKLCTNLCAKSRMSDLGWPSSGRHTCTYSAVRCSIHQITQYTVHSAKDGWLKVSEVIAGWS